MKIPNFQKNVNNKKRIQNLNRGMWLVLECISENRYKSVVVLFRQSRNTCFGSLVRRCGRGQQCQKLY